MNVREAIKRRQSVRAYLDHPIEEEKLIAVLEAGRLAPSASNRQRFVGEAPAVIVACAETDGHVMRGGLPCFPIDVAIALDHITLAAVEVGLGTCWIGAFSEEAVKAILGIPEEIRVVALMPIGYPADPTAIEKQRLPFNTVVRYDRW